VVQDVVLRAVLSRSDNLAAFGRNFYAPNTRNGIAGGAEVWTGHFQSLRLCQVSAARTRVSVCVCE
jgi:Argonaute linker 1 domain